MGNGNKVFIAGSRSLSRLSKDILRRIDNIIEKDLTILVGDANGIDKAVQQYLWQRDYNKVVVYCMEGGCRNNVGHWRTKTIPAAEPSRRDFAYFSTKDRAMVREADYGLMLWDGQSRGTLTSIIDLVKQEKPVVVYYGPGKSFRTLRQAGELARMLPRVDRAALDKIDDELRTFASERRASHRSHTSALF
jgi:hypothetical protein